LTACGPEPKQQENAFEIARQARLWNKFGRFVSDLIKIGKKIDESKADSGAMNKLVDGKATNHQCGEIEKWEPKLSHFRRI
jgi:DNA anti-recombination protein RmuC